MPKYVFNEIIIRFGFNIFELYGETSQTYLYRLHTFVLHFDCSAKTCEMSFSSLDRTCP